MMPLITLITCIVLITLITYIIFKTFLTLITLITLIILMNRRSQSAPLYNSNKPQMLDRWSNNPYITIEVAITHVFASQVLSCASFIVLVLRCY